MHCHFLFNDFLKVETLPLLLCKSQLDVNSQGYSHRVGAAAALMNAHSVSLLPSEFTMIQELIQTYPHNDNTSQLAS